jgi:hypothetical protein
MGIPIQKFASSCTANWKQNNRIRKKATFGQSWGFKRNSNMLPRFLMLDYGHLFGS